MSAAIELPNLLSVQCRFEGLEYHLNCRQSLCSLLCHRQRVDEMLGDLSFTYMRNGIELSIVPWGTPDLTEDCGEVSTTYCYALLPICQEVSKLLQQGALYSITSGGSMGGARGGPGFPLNFRPNCDPVLRMPP